MAIDLNGESLAVWNNLKPMIDEEIRSQTKGMVQRRKAKVTTAPSLVTKKIGVTEPFGDQYFIPYDAKVAGANVGDVVWIEYMYGASNAFASMFAKAVEDPRSCSATLSSAGWYRVMKLTGINSYEANGAGGFIVDFNIVRDVDTESNEAHKISLMATWNNIKFVNEQSVSNTLGITKIRTTNSGSNLYVDIYYGLSTQNTVTVAFNVTCRGGDQSKFNSQPFTSVAASPSGETELALYTFAANASGGIITNRAVGSLGSNSVLLPVPSGKRVIGARSAFYAGGLWFDGNGDTYYSSFTQIGSQDALTVDYYYY